MCKFTLLFKLLCLLHWNSHSNKLVKDFSSTPPGMQPPLPQIKSWILQCPAMML